MLTLSEIRSYYPGFLQDRGAFLLREYLQCKILELCETIDFVELARDVQPFLFHTNDIKRVELFPEFVKGMGWGWEKSMRVKIQISTVSNSLPWQGKA